MSNGDFASYWYLLKGNQEKGTNAVRHILGSPEEATEFINNKSAMAVVFGDHMSNECDNDAAIIDLIAASPYADQALITYLSTYQPTITDVTGIMHSKVKPMMNKSRALQRMLTTNSFDTFASNYGKLLWQEEFSDIRNLKRVADKIYSKKNQNTEQDNLIGSYYPFPYMGFDLSDFIGREVKMGDYTATIVAAGNSVWPISYNGHNRVGTFRLMLHNEKRAGTSADPHQIFAYRSLEYNTMNNSSIYKSFREINEKQLEAINNDTKIKALIDEYGDIISPTYTFFVEPINDSYEQNLAAKPTPKHGVTTPAYFYPCSAQSYPFDKGSLPYNYPRTVFPGITNDHCINYVIPDDTYFCSHQYWELDKELIERNLIYQIQSSSTYWWFAGSVYMNLSFDESTASTTITSGEAFIRTEINGSKNLNFGVRCSGYAAALLFTI